MCITMFALLVHKSETNNERGEEGTISELWNKLYFQSDEQNGVFS